MGGETAGRAATVMRYRITQNPLVESPFGHPSVYISQDVSLLTFPSYSLVSLRNVLMLMSVAKDAVRALLLYFGIKKHLLF